MASPPSPTPPLTPHPTRHVQEGKRLLKASLAKVDDDAFTVNGCVCACIVCCPMCSEYRRSPHDPWRFDEYKCGSLDDRHPWILTSADAMHGEVCCGDTSSTCCGMKGWKRGA